MVEFGIHLGKFQISDEFQIISDEFRIKGHVI